jgi:spore germination cell wall hydrolase CwlJ-like protein
MKSLFIKALIILSLTLPAVSSQQPLSIVQEVSSDIAQQTLCLAKNIYYEAASEPHEGKLAVAQVTINRANSSKYPSNFCGVVYQKIGQTCQFSWVCEKHSAPRDPYAWEESVYIAKRALTESVLHKEIAKAKAMFFHATYVRASYSNIRVVKKIGNHIFYTKV